MPVRIHALIAAIVRRRPLPAPGRGRTRRTLPALSVITGHAKVSVPYKQGVYDVMNPSCT